MINSARSVRDAFIIKLLIFYNLLKLLFCVEKIERRHVSKEVCVFASHHKVCGSNPVSEATWCQLTSHNWREASMRPMS